MNLSFLRMTAVLGLLLAVMASVPTAQTARTRPKVVNNSQPSYQHAYQYGYRAGYEDGYVTGKTDFNEGKSRDIEGNPAYSSADRGYQRDYGTRPEYQEAYRIGFEIAYNDGFFARPYTTSIPPNLGKVVVATLNAQSAPVASTEPNSSSSSGRARTNDDSRAGSDSDDRRGASRNTVVIADDIQMKIRLTSEISTKVNREGDRFTAVVLDPSEFADAEITGHIGQLNKSGKATGKTELSLVFDSIRLRDGRQGRFAAQVEKVYQTESVKTVDEEGNVETGSRTKDTAVRGVGGAALGAIIGGIAGGGKGAAIGAAIGAGVGAGSVFVQGGKELILSPGTEMLIRTAAPARSRN